jgi:hypothetical protein
VTDQITLFDHADDHGLELIAETITDRDGQGITSSVAAVRGSESRYGVIRIEGVSVLVDRARIERLLTWLDSRYSRRGESYRDALSAMIDEVCG